MASGQTGCAGLCGVVPPRPRIELTLPLPPLSVPYCSPTACQLPNVSTTAFPRASHLAPPRLRPPLVCLICKQHPCLQYPEVPEKYGTHANCSRDNGVSCPSLCATFSHASCFFFGADQDELACSAHRKVPETTSRNQGSQLCSSKMIPQMTVGTDLRGLCNSEPCFIA